MNTTRRLLLAAALAGGSLLLMSSGVLASGGDSHGGGRAAQPAHQQTAAAQQPSGSTCDVPGRACDPSKTDHDNGVGNNCDPGYGQGNQAKFPPDETATSCRSTSGTSGEAGSNSAPTQISNGCDTTATHHDNESATGSMHESSTAEAHDSGTRSSSASCQQTTGQQEQEVVETENGSTLAIEKVTVVEAAKRLTMTFAIKGATGTAHVVVTVNRGTSPATITVNGQELTETNLEMLIAGLSARLGQGGSVTLGANGGEVTIAPAAGGGFTITLPSGTVLAVSAGNLTTGTTTIAAGSTAEVGGVEVANGSQNANRPAGGTTLPAGSVAGLGGVSAMTANATAGIAAAGGNTAAAVGGAVSAATGAPLAQTGLPLLTGLLGLLLFGTGFVARRRR